MIGWGWIRAGLIDYAIVGGVDASLSRASIAAWRSLHVLAPTPCKPFDVDRQGTTLAEGAGVLLIEADDHAMRHGRPILCEIVSGAMTSDATHLTNPDARGMVRCMAQALRNGGLQPDDIGYINAHGTGTLVNDAKESTAIAAVFGTSRSDLAISSTKGAIGHTNGASGSIEAVVSVLSLTSRRAPPTANLCRKDPECLPSLVRESPTAIREGLGVMSNSFGFGGSNCSIIFGQYLGD